MIKKKDLIAEGKAIADLTKKVAYDMVAGEHTDTPEIAEWNINQKKLVAALTVHIARTEMYLTGCRVDGPKYICEKCNSTYFPGDVFVADPEGGIYDTYKCKNCGYEDWTDNCEIKTILKEEI